MYDPSGFSVNAEVQIKISLSSLTRARPALGSRSRRSWASLGKNLYSTGSSLHTELKNFTFPWKRSDHKDLIFFVKDLRLFSTSTSMIRLNLFLVNNFKLSSFSHFKSSGGSRGTVACSILHQGITTKDYHTRSHKKIITKSAIICD